MKSNRNFSSEEVCCQCGKTLANHGDPRHPFRTAANPIIIPPVICKWCGKKTSPFRDLCQHCSK